MALTDNIMAYYKLDEASGNATDSTGNGNTLTNNGTLLYGTGKINNGAVCVNASGMFLSANSNLGISDLTDFTITGWFNPAVAFAESAIWSLDFTGTSFSQNAIRVSSSIVKFDRGRRCVAQQHTDYSTTINAGTWYFFCSVFTASGTTVTGYLNGSSVVGPTTLSGVGTNGCSPAVKFFIGNDSDGTKCDGTMDEVGVWNRVLSGAEITTLYNGGAGLQYPFSSSTPLPFRALLGVGI